MSKRLRVWLTLSTIPWVCDRKNLAENDHFDVELGFDSIGPVQREH
eukprot:SAG22_NODE_1068_length_5742_cov_3.600390_6_plen_46_part_00